MTPQWDKPRIVEGKNIELVFTCWIEIEETVTMGSVTASHSQSRLAITMRGVLTALNRQGRILLVLLGVRMGLRK